MLRQRDKLQCEPAAPRNRADICRDENVATLLPLICDRMSPGMTPAAAALPLLSMLVTTQLDPLCIKCRPTSKRGSAMEAYVALHGAGSCQKAQLHAVEAQRGEAAAALLCSLHLNTGLNL